MSWLLKQAEDILNRVDQQANAAINHHPTISNSQGSSSTSANDSAAILDPSGNLSSLNSNRTSSNANRRSKKNDDADLMEFLNSSTPVTKKTTRTTTTTTTATNNPINDNSRTSSSPNMVADENFAKNNETATSKSATVTPRSITPATQTIDDDDDDGGDLDEGLVFNLPFNQDGTTVEQSSNKTNDHPDLKNEIISSLQAEIQTLLRDKRHCEQDLQTYKRQQIQYQHQIAESDALLRDLRSRESDTIETLAAKDSQIALLRVRLAESDDLMKNKTIQCEQLQNQCTRILQDHTDSSGIQSQAFDALQQRLHQLEHEVQQRTHDYERLLEEKHRFEKRSNDEKQQLIEQVKSAEKRLHDERSQMHEQQQQTKQAKNLVHQLEKDMNEYKSKAQRILQTKDKLIGKLKEIAQSRTNSDSQDLDHLSTDETSALFDAHLNQSSPNSSMSTSSNWASVQYEELKAENELFKQELQARELTIHNLRSELQESEALVQHAEEQLHEQTNQLNEQLKDERARLTLAEQDYRKLKQELSYVHEEYHRQKQTHLTQLSERERELERLRSQLTAKTINHVNDDELEKRLQALTESLIHKQTIIETLQTEKSSLTMQLERLEKRLDDYERIASMTPSNSPMVLSTKRGQSTMIDMDTNNTFDNDHDDTLRNRMSLLRETPYDPDIAKKMKRAANELDRLGIRLGVFLKRYPAVRLGVIFYAILLHLWTLIVLFTYTPEVHGNHNPLDLSHKS